MDAVEKSKSGQDFINTQKITAFSTSCRIITGMHSFINFEKLYATYFLLMTILVVCLIRKLHMS